MSRDLVFNLDGLYLQLEVQNPLMHIVYLRVKPMFDCEKVKQPNPRSSRGRRGCMSARLMLVHCWMFDRWSTEQMVLRLVSAWTRLACVGPSDLKIKGSSIRVTMQFDFLTLYVSIPIAKMIKKKITSQTQSYF